MKMLERLPRRVILATMPLLIWGVHFAVCYALVAAQCSPALTRPGAPERWGLLLLSGLALGACALLLWRAARAWSSQAGLMDWARAGSALLALVGIAWTSIPLFMLEGCS